MKCTTEGCFSKAAGWATLEGDTKIRHPLCQVCLINARLWPTSIIRYWKERT